MLAAYLGVVLMVAAAAPPAPAAAPSPAALPDRPLSLDDCVVIALAHNPQITASQQGVIAAEAGLTRARSSYYPQLSLDSVEGFTGSTLGSADTRQDLDLAARLTLWRRGRAENVAVSATSLHASELGHVSTVRDLVQQVAGNYYAVLAAHELLAVAQGGVESAQSHLEQVKARAALGATAEVDVFPADDDLARAQLDLIDARSDVRLALARLKHTLGVPPDTALDLAPAAPAVAGEFPSLAEALQTARTRRSELMQAEAVTRASRYAVTLARIGRGPLLDVSAQYDRGYADWNALDPAWGLLLTASWPLFDGYATRSDETSARAQLSRSEANLQQAINQVGLEVEDALVEAERTRERVDASAKSVAAAQARLAAAEGKYHQGVGILLEVIDARVAVTSALANQVRARYDHQTALVNLQRAIGTLAPPAAAPAGG
jgi:outer membrane protein